MLIKDILDVVVDNQKIGIVYEDSSGVIAPFETIVGDIAKVFSKKDIFDNNLHILKVYSVCTYNNILIIRVE